MKTRILSALAAALVALGMSGGAAADAQTAAIKAMEQERAAATESLARERAPYPRYFARAYARSLRAAFAAPLPTRPTPTRWAMRTTRSTPSSSKGR